MADESKRYGRPDLVTVESAMTTAGTRAEPVWKAPLVVLYDERCPLCRRLRGWLASQPTLAPVEYVVADSDEAHRRFPVLDHARTTTVLTMVRSDGAVYEGERAWLVAAWLLPRWQALAEHLSTRSCLPLVRAGARLVDALRVPLRDAPTAAGLGGGSYSADCERCRIVAPTPTPPRAGTWPPPGGRQTDVAPDTRRRARR